MNELLSMMSASLSHPVVDGVGWCLLHSLWQIALIAFLVRVAVACVSPKNPGIRYTLGMAGLLLALAAPVVTWPFVYAPAPVTQATPQPFLNSDSTQKTGQEITVTHVSAAHIAADSAVEAVRPQQTFIQSTREIIRPWLPTISCIWLAGMICFSLRPVTGLWTIRRLKLSAKRGIEQKIVDRFADLMVQMGVRRSVVLARSERASVPMVAGFLKPMVLLPASTLTNLSAAELDAVLAHELAHLKRYDDIVNLVQTMIETLFFFHPAIWWVSAIVRDERENCCDDLAVKATGSPRDLAGALLNLEQSRTIEPALSAKGGSLVKRIRRLAPLEQHGRRRRFPIAAFAGSMLLLMTVAILLFTANATSFADAPLQGIEEPAGSQLTAERPDRLTSVPILGELVSGTHNTAASRDQDPTAAQSDPTRIESVKLRVDGSESGVVISLDEGSREILEEMIREIVDSPQIIQFAGDEIDPAQIRFDVHNNPGGMSIVAENETYLSLAEMILHELMGEAAVPQNVRAGEDVFTHVIQLKHCQAEQIVSSVAELYEIVQPTAGPANIVADFRTNSLVINCTEEGADAIFRIVAALDKPDMQRSDAREVRDAANVGRRRAELLQAEMALLEADQRLAVARTNMEHTKQLFERGFVSEAEVRSSEFEIRQAELRFDHASQLLDIARAESETAADTGISPRRGQSPLIRTYATTDLQLAVGETTLAVSDEVPAEIVVSGSEVLRVDAVSNEMRIRPLAPGTARIELRNSEGQLLQVYEVKVEDEGRGASTTEEGTGGRRGR